MNLKEIERLLISHKFRSCSTENRFQRGSYSICLDTFGKDISVTLSHNGESNSITNPSINSFYGLFAYLELSTSQKKSIDKPLFQLDKHVEELISYDYIDFLSIGEKLFILKYQQYQQCLHFTLNQNSNEEKLEQKEELERKVNELIGKAVTSEVSTIRAMEAACLILDNKFGTNFYKDHPEQVLQLTETLMANIRSNDLATILNDLDSFGPKG